MGVLIVLEGVWDIGDEWGRWRRGWVSEATDAEEGYVLSGVIVALEDKPEIIDVVLYKEEMSWYDGAGEKECRGEWGWDIGRVGE